MSEMIERGSAAMRAKRLELIAQPLDRIWPDLMRAAIGSMREPTESMGDQIIYSQLETIQQGEELWRSMIDAALGDSRSEPASPQEQSNG